MASFSIASEAWYWLFNTLRNSSAMFLIFIGRASLPAMVASLSTASVCGTASRTVTRSSRRTDASPIDRVALWGRRFLDEYSTRDGDEWREGVDTTPVANVATSAQSHSCVAHTRRRAPESPRVSGPAFSVLQHRRDIALRHEADRNTRHLFHRHDIHDRNIVRHRIRHVRGLSVRRERHPAC